MIKRSADKIFLLRKKSCTKKLIFQFVDVLERLVSEQTINKMGAQKQVELKEVALAQGQWPGLDGDDKIHESELFLSLSRKGIVKILPAMGKLTGLIEMHLSFNHLEELPCAIGKLKNLKSLILHHNKIKDLPSSFGNLSKLDHVSLSSNCLARVPDALRRLPALKELMLDHNPFEEKIVFSANWNTLNKLNISGCNQMTISSTINNLDSLESLSIAENYLETLPNLACLYNLEYLSISEMKVAIWKLPEALSQLRSLKVLWCNKSGLRHLPEWLGSLKSLKHLDFSSNGLEELPASIGRLRRLSLLDVSDNQLSSIPKSLAKIKQLKHLNIRINPITSLPSAIFEFNPQLILYADGYDKAEDMQPESISKCNGQLQRLAVIAARKLLRMGGHFTNADMPESCLELIRSAKECSNLHCKGTFVRGGGVEGSRLVSFPPCTKVLVDTHTCDFQCTNASPLNRT